MNDEDIDFEDQNGDENAEADGIPQEVRVLRTQAYDKGVSDLVEMMHNEDVILDPDYQRNYVWDNKRASLLVESILLNVPIPVIYVAEDDDGCWLVVDGLQRLSSLRRFFDNEFKLTSMELLKELNGQQFSTLNPKAQRILKNGIIRVIVIKAESHPEIKYDIFQRLNRGAVKLNEQELRNCMYRGPLSALLKEFSKYQPFLQALGLKKPHDRFMDAELALRFLAIDANYSPESGKVAHYPNKMKTFLNRFMDERRKLTPEELLALKNRFLSTIDKVVSIFDSPCFRRALPEGKLDSRTNRALMDAMMVSMARFDASALKAHAVQIRSLHSEVLLKDSAYNDSLIYGTSDTKRLELRINTWYSGLGRIISKA